MKVLLKADDFGDNNYLKWLPIFEIVQNLRIPLYVGAIGSRLNEPLPPKILKLLDNSEFIHVFNHGHHHKQDESNQSTDFFNTSYLYQKGSIEKCQQKIFDRLGRNCSTFGPPFNKYDATTIKVLMECEFINDVFDIPFIPGKNCIGEYKFIKCERPITGRQFDYDFFKTKLKPFTKNNLDGVIQIHPANHWDTNSERRFEAALIELIEDKVTFSTFFEK